MVQSFVIEQNVVILIIDITHIVMMFQTHQMIFNAFENGAVFPYKPVRFEGTTNNNQLIDYWGNELKVTIEDSNQMEIVNSEPSIFPGQASFDAP